MAVWGIQVSCWPQPSAAADILPPPGEHSPPEPEPGQLRGGCDLHPPLQRLPQLPMKHYLKLLVCSLL